jgi:hypothetical protein
LGQPRIKVNVKELHPMSQTTSQIGMGHHTGFGHGGRSDHTEGTVARMIEEQTAKLPSDVFLWAAGASILGSLALKLSGREHQSLFVGQWAPTLLILGLYNKIVKVAGSDGYRS